MIAALTGLFRGVLLPYLIRRIVEGLHIDRELHEVLRPATNLLLGALIVLFALAVSHQLAVELGLVGTPGTLALTVMLATVLVGFLMLSVRVEAASQVIALLVVENGIRVGALILVPHFPLLLELMILFDILVAVACFGVLVRYLQVHVGTTSMSELRRLVG
jgi:hydrogenase-4 component E